MVVGATNAGANPRLNDLPRNRRYPITPRVSKIMAGMYCQPPGNRAQLTSRVERGMQQADREDAAARVDELGAKQISEEWRD